MILFQLLQKNSCKWSRINQPTRSKKVKLGAVNQRFKNIVIYDTKIYSFRIWICCNYCTVLVAFVCNYPQNSPFSITDAQISNWSFHNEKSGEQLSHFRFCDERKNLLINLGKLVCGRMLRTEVLNQIVDSFLLSHLSCDSMCLW